MSEINTDNGNMLLEIKPVEEVVNEPENNITDIEKKIEEDIEKEIEQELEAEKQNEIFEKKEKPKKKKRQLSERQKKHLENMRIKKAEKARKKKEEKMKAFKEKVEGKTENPINTHKSNIPNKKISHNQPKVSQNHDDDYLFRNMERMVGLFERMNKINNNKQQAHQPVYQQPKPPKSKPIPIQKKQEPKVNLYGFDDFF